jgi:radical SAM superfamily enzyme YgiQ (UPF0313 family)
MDLILINAPSPQLEDDLIAPPIGLMCLAAYVEEKHSVRILDMCGNADLKLLENCESKVIGLTLQSTQYKWVHDAIPKLRKLYPNSKIVLGGHHASALPNETMSELQPDCVVIGDGEDALVRILNGETGIIYGKQVDINIAPRPAYHLINIKQYHRTINGILATTIMSSRGCPFACHFCAKLPNSKYRYRNPDLVIEDIKFLRDTYGIKAIQFHDDDFTYPNNRLVAIANGLRSLRITWRCMSRTTNINFDLLKHMKDCGCYEICFGVESGSDRILKFLNKQATSENNKNAIINAKRAGLKVLVCLMINVPTETQEDIELTKKLILETKPDSWLLNSFIPTVGSEMWGNPDKYGFKILSHDFTKYHSLGKHGKGGMVTDSKYDVESVRNEFLQFLKSHVKDQHN